MAAEVSSTLVRIMNGGDMKESSSSSTSSSSTTTTRGAGKSTALITQDLLGGCRSTVDSKELDLDLQVPSGWEKRLDLKSGKVYLERCNSWNSSSSTREHNQHNCKTIEKKFQDLNFPPGTKKPLSLFEDMTNLDLKLINPTSSSTPSSSSYHSVCTLEKVRSALERAEKESSSMMTRKRSISSVSVSMCSSSPTSNSSSSIKDVEMDRHDHYNSSSPNSSFAAGCPSCLLYVLISKSNPRCPRCNSIVPSPVALKKPCIDLNISI